jgi:endonuclease/exonuclease/phosphatase family metal-dependent hydrolase
MKKILLVLLTFLVLFILGFYFWGSLGFYDEEKYDQIKTYGNKPLVDKDTLTVMTYNIGYLSGMTNNLPVDRSIELYQNNLQRARDLMREINPDIIGFQEIDFEAKRSYKFNQLDSLADTNNYHQSGMAVNWDKRYVPFPYWPIKNHFGKMLSGQATLSKFPIVENKRMVLRKPVNAPFYYNAFYLDRVIQINEIQVGEKTLIFMNVHLEAFDTETRELQAEILLKVYKKYAAFYPVILVGDFNSRPPFATEIIEEENTIALFLDEPSAVEAIPDSVYLSDEAHYFTFDTEESYERLDYIFYTPDKIQPIEADVVRAAADISDHLPVMMKFTFVNDTLSTNP